MVCDLEKMWKIEKRSAIHISFLVWELGNLKKIRNREPTQISFMVKLNGFCEPGILGKLEKSKKKKCNSYKLLGLLTGKFEENWKRRSIQISFLVCEPEILGKCENSKKRKSIHISFMVCEPKNLIKFEKAGQLVISFMVKFHGFLWGGKFGKNEIENRLI